MIALTQVDLKDTTYLLDSRGTRRLRAEHPAIDLLAYDGDCVLVRVKGTMHLVPLHMVTVMVVAEETVTPAPAPDQQPRRRGRPPKHHNAKP